MTEGLFLVAFGRDHDASAMLDATRSDRTTGVDRLAIASDSYRIKSLPVPKYQRSEAEFIKIRGGELGQIKTVRAQAAVLVRGTSRQAVQRPAFGRVSGAFGAQSVYTGEKGSYRSGEDIGVPTGTPAATCDPITLGGHLLMVGHGMGLDSAFLYASHSKVKVGDVVKRGQVIGENGITGGATGPHLHRALTWRSERIDPKLVAGPMPGAALAG